MVGNYLDVDANAAPPISDQNYFKPFIAAEFGFTLQGFMKRDELGAEGLDTDSLVQHSALEWTCPSIDDGGIAQFICRAALR